MAKIIRAPGGSGGGGVPMQPGYTSGHWFLPVRATLGVGSAIGAGIARFIPFIPERNLTINQLGVRCTTLGSSNIQLAVYNNVQGAAGSRPGTEIGHTGNIVNTATGALSAAFSDAASHTLVAGTLYWLAIIQNDSTGVFVNFTSLSSILAYVAGSATLGTILGSAAATMTHLSTPLTFGTWGDLTGATWTEQVSGQYAMIAVKVA